MSWNEPKSLTIGSDEYVNYAAAAKRTGLSIDLLRHKAMRGEFTVLRLSPRRPMINWTQWISKLGGSTS
jgi:hypothetical protein